MEQKNFKSGDAEWLKDKLWQRWEIIRRHPDYRDFCDRYSTSFDKDGFFVSDFGEEEGLILNQFRLTLIPHYERDLSGNLLLDGGIVVEPTAVEYIWKTVEVDPGHRHKMEDGTTVTTESTAIWDEQFIKLKIDLSDNRAKAQILDEVWEHIEEARRIAKITGKKGKAATIKCDDLKIWDLAKEGKSPGEIAKLLWPEEYDASKKNDDVSSDRRYKELTQMYKKQGIKDYDDRAYVEAYGQERKSGSFLHQRVLDAINRVSKLLSAYDLETPR